MSATETVQLSMRKAAASPKASVDKFIKERMSENFHPVYKKNNRKKPFNIYIITVRPHQHAGSEHSIFSKSYVNLDAVFKTV